jgi:hypothetical protein
MLRGRSNNCDFVRMFASGILFKYCRDDAKLIEQYVEDYNRRHPATPIQVNMSFTTPPEAHVTSPPEAEVVDPRYPQVPLVEVQEQAPAVRQQRGNSDYLPAIVDRILQHEEAHKNDFLHQMDKFADHHAARMRELYACLRLHNADALPSQPHPAQAVLPSV